MKDPKDKLYLHEPWECGNHENQVWMYRKDVEKYYLEDGKDDFMDRIESIRDYCANHKLAGYKDYAAAYRQFRKKDRLRSNSPYPIRKTQAERHKDFFDRVADMVGAKKPSESEQTEIIEVKQSDSDVKDLTTKLTKQFDMGDFIQ